MQRASEVERWRQRSAGPPSFLEYAFFAWVNPILRKGCRRPLEQSDLLQLVPLHQPANNEARLWDFWEQEQEAHGDDPRLLRAILKVYGARYFAIAGLKLLNDALNFAGPLLLNVLVTYLSNPVAKTTSGGSNVGTGVLGSWWAALVASWHPDGPWLGYWCAGLLMLSCVLKAFLNTHYNYQLSILSCRLRSALMCSLYRKALMLRCTDLDARLHTLMAVDTSATVNLLLSFHELWSLPLQIAVAFCLLFVQVRFCFLSGVAVCVLMIPVNRWIALRIQAASARMMKHKDARIAAVSELLQGIHAIKMLAWEHVLANKIQQHRSTELSALATRKYLDALCVYFWVATSGLFSLFTFGLMALLGQPLTPAVVFTSLALFNILITPLNAFPWVINGVMEALVSLGRLQSFLHLAPSHSLDLQLLYSNLTHTPSTSSGEASSASSGHFGPTSPVRIGRTSSSHLARVPSIGRLSPTQAGPNLPRLKDPDKPWIIRVAVAQFKDACFSWRGEAGPLCLQDMCLCLLAGVVTSVVGQVGSGKSSLLAALMGELSLVKGSCTVRPGKVGYVTQTPWLISGTIRDNILLGRPLHEQLYYEVLTACALDQDLLQMLAGDGTLVGDRGCTLSGGQRVRVALARVLYQRCDLYLLDDILSCLDQDCSSWLVQNVLAGPMLEYRTVVVSTKSLACIRASQHVVRLERGHVLFAGSSHQFLEEHAETFLAPASASGTDDEHDGIIKWDATSERSDGMDSLCGTASTELDQQGEQQASEAQAPAEGVSPTKQAGEEEREVGHVKLQVYGHYLKSVGRALVLAVAASLLLMQLSRNGNDLWISYWVSHTQCCRPSVGPNMCKNPHHRLSVPDVSQVTHATHVTPHSGAAAPTDNTSFSAAAVSLAALPCTASILQATRAALGTACSQAVTSSATKSNATNSNVTNSSPALLAFGGGKTPKACKHFMHSGSTAGRWLRLAGGAPLVLVSAGSSAQSAYAHGQVQSLMYQPLWRFSSLTSAAAASDWGPAGGAVKNASKRHGKSSGSRKPACRSSGDCVDSGIDDRSINDSKISSQATATATATATTTATANADKYMQPQVPRTAASLRQVAVGGATSVAISAGAAAPATRAAPPLQVPQQAKKQTHGQTQQRISRKLASYATGAVPMVQHHQHHASDAANVKFKMDPNMYLFFKGLCVIAGLNTLFTLVRAFSFAFAGLEAASHMHAQLLDCVLALPMRFFDTLSVGRLMSRFSTDVNTVDDSLPFMLNILLANSVSLLGALGLMATAQPLMLAMLLPLVVLYRYIQLHYQSSAREIRRLDSLTLSPIYGGFSEVLEGSACIRGLQLQTHFAYANIAAVAANQQAAMTAAVSSNWLNLRLQLLAAMLVGVVGALGVAAKQGLLPAGMSTWDAGLVGLSLSYALPIVSLLNGLLTSSAETEQEMVAVERICQYLDLPPQAGVLAPVTLPGREGAGVGTLSTADGASPKPALLEVLDVYMHYAPSLPWALKGVTFTVRPGEKVGVCGRTGAGKSSVMRAILRLTELQHGAILLRGTDVRTIPLGALRGALGVVPQAPFLFAGSVRENLDPAGMSSDETLRAVLQDVQMWEVLMDVVRGQGVAVAPVASQATPPCPSVSSPLSGEHSPIPVHCPAMDTPYSPSITTPLLGFPVAPCETSPHPLTNAILDLPLTSGGKALSYGQRQLLCLARVLLKHTELFLLDECTAGMDPRTSAVIRSVLAERVGAGGAVLQVAHDLDAIMGYDSVLVMEGGSIVERGPPKQLLSQPRTCFSSLWRGSGR